MRTAIIQRSDPLRALTETFISDVYRDNFGARIATFAPTLVAMSQGSEVLCAAGLRFAADGFFSQCYVDKPIEQVLSGLQQRTVAAERIFEVSSLCSRSPSDAPRFLRQLVALGEQSHCDWVIFTATDRLRRLLVRLGLPLTVIAPADPLRVENAEDWGTYYQSLPAVVGVNRQIFEAANRRPVLEACHA